ncbi:hypothetical protein GE09DRAFT_1126395 [Coniochaeta sp. 2T2.1]|nr:hypothetical protein GE09DRAFT_1126395 [Coniochaeta sp. 2T2.1]
MHEIPKQPATPAQSLQLQGISERAGERNSPVTPMTLPLVPRISLSSPNQPSSPAIVWHLLGHPQSLLDQSLRQVTGRVQPRQFRLNLLLRGQKRAATAWNCAILALPSRAVNGPNPFSWNPSPAAGSARRRGPPGLGHIIPIRHCQFQASFLKAPFGQTACGLRFLPIAVL